MQKAVVLFAIGVFISVCPSCVQGAVSCSLYEKIFHDGDVVDLFLLSTDTGTQCGDCLAACNDDPSCNYYQFQNETATSLPIPFPFNCPPESFGVATPMSCDYYNGGQTLVVKVPASTCTDCYHLCFNDNFCWYYNFHAGDSATGVTDYRQDVCPVSGGGSGDPHFTGFDGSPFEYHGHDGAIFNIYSDASLQVNAELSSFGIHGKTFMKSIGVKTYPPCNSFKFTSILEVSDGPTWIAHVESHVSDKDYHVSSGEWTSAEGGITLKQIPTTDGSFEVVLSTPRHRMHVRKEWMSLHLNFGMELLTPRAPLSAHGVLGQTLGWTVGSERALAGDEMSYIVGGIFKDDFAFNMFEAICGWDE